MIGSTGFWTVATMAVTAYCALQTVRDVRAKQYRWAAAAAVAALLLAAMPTKTNAVTIDLAVARR